MDILYTTRTKNKIVGYNNNKKIYNREFDSINTAKIIQTWIKQYIKLYGSISIDKMNMNINYILSHKFNPNNY